MKALYALLLALCFASTANAQNIFQPGYHGAVGPYQPSRVGGYWFYNSSARYYPVAAPYGYGRGYRTYLEEESLYELRSIRRELEYGRRR